MPENEFWHEKSLEEMSHEEWESLCDGCARCCLLKLEDEKTAEIVYTDIACRLLDHGLCQCTQYPKRNILVPDCVDLTPKTVRDLNWMPTTCAYRLLAEGEDLYWWHPLVSGDPNTVHLAGISVRNRIVGEGEGHDPEDRIVDWPV